MTTEQLISLPVVSLYDQKQVGVVTNILVNTSKKITALVIVDEEQYNSYIIYTKDIYALGHAAVIVKNSSMLQLQSNVELSLTKLCSPIRQIIVDVNGDYFGQVTNLEFDNKFQILSVNSFDQKFTANMIHLCSHMVVVCEKKFSVNKFKPNSKITANIKPADLPMVNILSTQILPKREVTNYSYLIGKIVTKDILNINGEVIVKQNTKINSFVLDKVKNFGKLKELAINCKA